MRHVGHKHSPALDVEDGDELDQVKEGKPGGHEETHPDHAYKVKGNKSIFASCLVLTLVVDSVEDVLGHIKLWISRKTPLQVPEPAVVHNPDKQ